MRYVPYGRTGIEVSTIALGGHEYLDNGLSRGFNEEFADAVKPGYVAPGYGGPRRKDVLSAAYDLGINLFDVTIDPEKEALGRNLAEMPPPYPVYIQSRPEGMCYGYDEGNRSMLDYATAMALTGDTVPEALIDPDTRRTQSAADSQELAELSLRRAAASTMLVPPRLFTFDPYLQSDVLNIDGAMNRNLTLQRATLLVLALQVWHREHGQFPRYLSQLAEVLLTDVPPDSLSTGAWGYAPEGLPAPLLVSRRTVVPAGQPLLWSRGPFDLDIVYYSRSQQTGVGETPPNRYVVTPFYRPTQDPSPGVNDSSGGEPQPNRIRFLLLGTD